ncbi:hypothetical protein XAP6164_1020004 [Xanthomonas phaseoli pv. phaseoli]|nr:hypothetical protein XAP6164_1020004 [Xanthomonas phaseoli pv. phaseoli]
MADAGAVFPLVARASRAGKSKTRPDPTAAPSKRTAWLIHAVAAPGAFRAGFPIDLFVFAIRGFAADGHSLPRGISHGKFARRFSSFP